MSHHDQMQSRILHRHTLSTKLALDNMQKPALCLSEENGGIASSYMQPLGPLPKVRGDTTAKTGVAPPLYRDSGGPGSCHTFC